MPNSMPSNFPAPYQPGEKPSAASLNTLSDALKNAANTKPSSGIQSNSQSSANSVSANERLLNPPIWAMITNVSMIVIPADYYKVPEGWSNMSTCYGTFRPGGNIFYQSAQNTWCYSWVEVEQNLLIGRNAIQGKKYGNDIFDVPNSFIPKPGSGISQPVCYRIPPIVNEGLRYGTVRKNPAYDVNQLGSKCLVGPGKIVRLYFGAGEYMLFSARKYTFDQNQNHDFEQPWLPDRDHP